MDTQLSIHKKKVYLSTILALSLCLLFVLNLLFMLGGIILHYEFCILNTRVDFIHYKNLQSRLKQGLRDKGWEQVRLHSRFGYILEGTYIPNPIPSDKTLIFLHGIAATQNMALHYEEQYINQGYNLLIYDSRGHGASGGSCTTWGYYERYDLDQWVDWLLAKNPQSIIGVHGVSMGAATALMHAALNEPTKRVKFYIADSAYSDLTYLITQRIISQTQSKHPFWIQILIKYASLAAYFQSDFLYENISPINEVTQVTTPILYLHGEADTLVPPKMSKDLYEATKGYRELHVFPKTKHGRAIIERKSECRDTVINFLNLVSQE